MALSFQILKSLDLVYVKYIGFVELDASLKTFAEYAAHPDCRPGQKQLIDLAQVTDLERDFTKIMKHQAQKADVFTAGTAETVVVYYAPTEIAQRMAQIAARSWEDVEGIICVILEDEAQALAVLGLAHNSIAEMLHVHA